MRANGCQRIVCLVIMGALSSGCQCQVSEYCGDGSLTSGGFQTDFKIALPAIDVSREGRAEYSLDRVCTDRAAVVLFGSEDALTALRIDPNAWLTIELVSEEGRVVRKAGGPLSSTAWTVEDAQQQASLKQLTPTAGLFLTDLNSNKLRIRLEWSPGSTASAHPQLEPFIVKAASRGWAL